MALDFEAFVHFSIPENPGLVWAQQMLELDSEDFVHFLNPRNHGLVWILQMME